MNTPGLVAILTGTVILFYWSAGRASRRHQSARPTPDPRHVQASHLVITLATMIATAIYLSSVNSTGHRAKGLLMIGVAITLYFLLLRHTGSLAQSLGSYAVVVLAAILTLTLDWDSRVQQWIGVTSQIVAGALGVIACAALSAKQQSS